MKIHRLLESHAFTREDAAALVSAYEAALTRLGVPRGDDRAAELVAHKIIDIAGDGARQPDTLCERAVWSLMLARTDRH
jgi:hypothetical protein